MMHTGNKGVNRWSLRHEKVSRKYNNKIHHNVSILFPEVDLPTDGVHKIKHNICTFYLENKPN